MQFSFTKKWNDPVYTSVACFCCMHLGGVFYGICLTILNSCIVFHHVYLFNQAPVGGHLGNFQFFAIIIFQWTYLEVPVLSLIF